MTISLIYIIVYMNTGTHTNDHTLIHLYLTHERTNNHTYALIHISLTHYHTYVLTQISIHMSTHTQMITDTH